MHDTPKGPENLEQYGQEAAPHLTSDVADWARYIAVTEGCSMAEVIRRALVVYKTHLDYVQDGYEGPIYKAVPPDRDPSLLQKIKVSIGLAIPDDEPEQLRVVFNFHPEDEA